MQKKHIQSNKTLIMSYYNYHFFNNFYITYSYINQVNVLNKIKNSTFIFYSKSFLLLQYNKILNIYAPFLFLINANISIEGNIKRYNLLSIIRRALLYPFVLYLMPFINNMFGVLFKTRFIKFFKTWYMSINRKEAITYNLNNLILYFIELLMYTRKLQKFYSYIKISYIYLFKFLKKFKRSNKYIFKNFKMLYLLKFLNILGYKQKVNINVNFLKKYNTLKKNMYYIFLKSINNIINYYNALQICKLNYFNKFINIYNKFINLKNLINVKYIKFSFILKKKNKKIKYYYEQKKYNIFFLINNMIFKLLYFIFLFWINMYFQLQQNYSKIYLYKFKNNFLVIYNIFPSYYDIKYRNKKFKKLIFLDYFIPIQFLLYYKQLTY